MVYHEAVCRLWGGQVHRISIQWVPLSEFRLGRSLMPSSMAVLVHRGIAFRTRRHPEHFLVVARAIRHQVQLGRGEAEGRRRLRDWLFRTPARRCGGMAAKGRGEGRSGHFGVRIFLDNLCSLADVSECWRRLGSSSRTSLDGIWTLSSVRMWLRSFKLHAAAHTNLILRVMSRPMPGRVGLSARRIFEAHRHLR